ncbi:MAG: hypothetical protein ACOZIN_00295 [Myxococcota bacterium]
MDSPHRIQPTAFTPTVGRQTPKVEFGEVLAHTIRRVAHVGGALASGMATGIPVVSAAVSGIQSMVTAASSVRGSAVAPIGSRASASTAEAVQPDSTALLDLQSQQSEYYLKLQWEMQRESREFNALSNVLKVRHDSAKAAINNIR